jgi:hypothetical protein
VVQYRNADGETANVYVTGTQPAAPAAPVVVGAITGGTLAAATYSYMITAVVGGAESEPSAAATDAVDSGTTGSVEITLPGDDGVQYGIYGRVGGSEEFIALTAAGATEYVDTGAITPDGDAPTDDGRIGAQQYHPKRTLGRNSGTVLVKATTMKSVNAYFKHGQ